MLLSKGRSPLSLLMAVTLFLTAGCGFSQYETLRGNADQPAPAEAPAESASLQRSPVLSIPAAGTVNLNYNVPVQLPSAFVDQLGYDSDSDKTVILRGRNLSESFEIRDASTDETVFTGTTRAKSEDNGIFFRIGSFSGLTAPGSYYVYNDSVGSSYSFTISGDSTDKLTEETLRCFYHNRCGITLTEALAGQDAHSACHTLPAVLQSDRSVQMDVSGGWHLDSLADRDVCLGCEVADTLLLAYELFPDSFSDDMNIPESGDGIPDVLGEVMYEILWLMKMQDPRTGGVYGSAVTVGANENSTEQELYSARIEVTPVTLQATIAFASTLAMFSYDYQSYDASFSTNCLRAADRAYRFYIKNAEASDYPLPAQFAAATRLYRATGWKMYRDVLMDFFSQTDFMDRFTDDDSLLSGSITYLMTRQPQDTGTCSMLMSALLKKAETVSSTSLGDPWLVLQTSRPYELPHELQSLIFVDRIITNSEYTGVIADHVHFLCGMNEDAVNYITDTTDRTYRDTEDTPCLLADPLRAAQFLLLVSAL